MKSFYPVLFCLLALSSFAQEPGKTEKSKKGTIYFGFGSHRSFYTPSDIHVQRRGDPVFDFTLSRVKAKDEGGVRFHTAPQFSYVVGYYFQNKGFGLEYRYDHIKYFVQQGQRVPYKGTINGKYEEKDTVLTPDFFRMEHSDGGNFAMLNIVKWIPLLESRNEKLRLELILKAGAGVVNPKTNTTILGNHRDDKYHISGYVTGLEGGVKVNFLKHFFVTGTAKGSYANYRQFLISNGYGRHHFFAGQLIYMAGAQFSL